MPAYFSGLGSVSFDNPSVTAPSAPSVDAPSVNFDIQSAIDAGAAAAAAAAGPQGNSGVRGDNPTTVAQEFAQAKADAEAQFIAAQETAALPDSARSGPATNDLVNILSGRTTGTENRTGFIGPAPYGGGTMANAAQVKGGYFTGDGTRSSRDSDDSGWVFTDATTEAAKNANQGFLASLIPGQTTITQDPMTGSPVKGYSFSPQDALGLALMGTPIGPMASMYNMTRGPQPTEPTMMSRGQFKSSLQPSYNDNFDMDDVNPPSLDEIQRLAEALNPSDPTDPATDPTPPAVKQYYKPPQWVLDRIAGNLNYGKGRLG